MKKIVGLVLASVMALGTTAFAAGNVDTKGKKVAKKPVAARKQQTGQTMQNTQAPTKKTVAKSRKHSTKRHRASHKSSKKRTHKSTKKTMAPTKTKS